MTSMIAANEGRAAEWVVAEQPATIDPRAIGASRHIARQDMMLP